MTVFARLRVVIYHYKLDIRYYVSVKAFDLMCFIEGGRVTAPSNPELQSKPSDAVAEIPRNCRRHSSFQGLGMVTLATANRTLYILNPDVFSLICLRNMSNS